MSHKRRPVDKSPLGHRAAGEPGEVASPLRIIGGTHRGRKLFYSGDPRTRPMKARVRESVFNLLGPSPRGHHAIDLFAGTGALGLEALSRGATRATFFERHFPTAEGIRQNAAALQLQDVCDVIPANTFIQFRRDDPLVAPGHAASTTDEPLPWLVFCSPPYDLFVDQLDEMLQLLDQVFARAPSGSVIVVEADARFDFARLPHAGQWDIREYPPAFVGIYRVE